MTECRRWVIVNKRGLYEGQWRTRAAAIARHVSDLQRTGARPISPYPMDGKLTADQRRAWHQYRALGHRAVVAMILYAADDDG